MYVKVVLEDFVYGIAGFWSLDLSERVVREKIGSILVVISMILYIEASKVQNDPVKEMEKELSSVVKYGEFKRLNLFSLSLVCYQLVKLIKYML